jgi:ketosteroid isomerase-like protein
MSPSDFMRRYEAATDRHDLDATLSMIAADAIYLFSDESAHVGKAAVAQVLAANFNAIRNESYRIHDLVWLVESDTAAACVYEFAWSGEIDGKPASGNGRGTSVLRRDGEGWLVAHEHLSRGRLR